MHLLKYMDKSVISRLKAKADKRR